MLHEKCKFKETSSRAHWNEVTLRAEELALEKWCQNTVAGTFQDGLTKKNYAIVRSS